MSCFLTILTVLGHAQNDIVADTAVDLKYQLDTVIAADTIESTEEEADVMASGSSTDQQEYFLRKEFTGGFGDSLASTRKIPDTTMSELRKDKAFWYANGMIKKKQAGQKQSFTAHPLFQTILWIVIITGFVVFIFLYLANSNINLFRRSVNIAAKEEAADVVDIFSIDYHGEINKAINSGDYRVAVRLLFLQLLRNLSDRNIIEYKPDNTNLDYLQQLHNTNLHTGFAWLARNYEYTWYGHFDIDKEKFDLVKREYEKFEHKNLSVA